MYKIPSVVKYLFQVNYDCFYLSTILLLFFYLSNPLHSAPYLIQTDVLASYSYLKATVSVKTETVAFIKYDYSNIIPIVFTAPNMT